MTNYEILFNALKTIADSGDERAKLALALVSYNVSCAGITDEIIKHIGTINAALGGIHAASSNLTVADRVREIEVTINKINILVNKL